MNLLEEAESPPPPRPLHLAVCLYGQPRNYQHGNTTITTYLGLQDPTPRVDFFYHAWIVQDITAKPYSPWRDIDPQTVIINNPPQVIEELYTLYQPVLYVTEPQKMNFDIDYKNTLAYHNSCDAFQNNVNNVFSQMYSRNQVRNLLHKHATETNTTYDAIIMCRFDYWHHSTLELNTTDLSKTIVGSSGKPRKIFADNFIIAPQTTFLDWFNTYENLPRVLNNRELEQKMKDYGERLMINAEELIFANYLLHNDNIDNLAYLPKIIG